MAKILSKSGIASLNIVRPGQVSQSVDAFTGIEEYDIYLSGSFNTTGSITCTGNISGSARVFGTHLISSTVIDTPTIENSNGDAITFSDSINIPNSNHSITSSGAISSSGYISGSSFIGDGSSLTNLQRPITSSTTHFTASNNNTGFYFRADGSVTCSIQQNSVVTCDIGNEFEIFQTSSAGYILFSTGSGVTLNSKSNHQKLAGQFSAATLKKVGTDEWDLIGDLG